MAKNKAHTAPATAVATTPATPAVANPPTAPAAGGSNALPTGNVATMLANLNIVGGLGGIPNSTPPAPVAVAKTKTPGVSPNARTRAYFAGQVIAQTGHHNGVTPAMVAQVCHQFGVENPTESAICLRNAWHAIRAFMATNGLTMPTAPPAPATPPTAPPAN